jgi:hypothetical protein
MLNDAASFTNPCTTPVVLATRFPLPEQVSVPCWLQPAGLTTAWPGHSRTFFTDRVRFVEERPGGRARRARPGVVWGGQYEVTPGQSVGGDAAVGTGEGDGAQANEGAGARGGVGRTGG